MILAAPKLLASWNSPQINDGAVLISRGMVQAIGPEKEIRKNNPRQRIYRFKNSAILPGLVNVHTHLELPALLDAIRAETFPNWVLNLIQAKKNLAKKDYVAASNNNIDLLIKTGTTTVGEICTHDISPSVLKQKGLRSIIFREIISMNQPRSLILLRRLKPFDSPRADSAATSLLSNGFSPHSPYTVSEDLLRQINTVSEQKKLRVCMHIAESRDEIRLLQGKKSGIEKIYKFAGWNIDRAPKGSSSFEYLNRIGFLSPHLLAVHAVQVTDEDIRLIRKSKTSIAHCPRSNKELGVGRMPLKNFLDAGITVGLGTDSLASSPNLNMWDEMRYTLQIHKKDGITAKDIFEVATIGCAKALDLDKEIGTLEPGKKADIIAVPLPSKNTGDIYSDLLRETKSCIMTMVNGKILHLDTRYRG